jgi:WD40 repeat protein
MDWVVDWVVERGGGFMMAGGYTTFDAGHYDQTVWEHITPVDMLAFGDGFNEQRFRVEIPKSVRKHPTWRISPDPAANEAILDTHPDFTGMNRVRRAKPGALVLMTRPELNNEPVIAVQQYGRGRSMAYLGDPNGGWARYLVGWGPPGGPAQGPHTELGHGAAFHVNVAATHAASGPPPPHPSPYYAQYFVNVVNWLGENSVRWRRDKLAGRVTTAQAQPGRDLPVAAEVLSVTKLDDVLALDVGARLDAPGSRRVRLEFNRDRREFVGQLPIPADWGGGELSVLFDTLAAGESLTDSARVGVLHANPEFAESAPDRAFLAELAKIGGGRVIESVSDAVAVCRDSAGARAQEEHRSWRQPIWTRWPWWTAFALALCFEWALRRRAATNAAMAAALVLLIASASDVARAQETTPPAPPPSTPALSATEINALVDQLGAPRVRLRDEAESKLEAIPEAFEFVKTAAKDSSNTELRLRARNVLQVLRRNLWQEENAVTKHSKESYAQKLIASADGQTLYSRGEDAVIAWNPATLESKLSLGPKSTLWRDWQRDGPAGTLALSPDGQRLVCTDAMGTILVYKTADGSELARFTNQDPEDTRFAAINFRAVWGAGFLPDGKLLATVDRVGYLRFWDSENGKLILSATSLPGNVCRAMAVSPDGKLIAVSTDLGGQPDRLWIYDVEHQKWTHMEETLHRSFSLQFSHDGRLLLAGNHGGLAILYKVSPEGVLSDERRIGPVGNGVWCSAFSSDEKSIFSATEDTEGQLSEWGIDSNEELWRSPVLEKALTSVVVLGPDRVATIGRDQAVRIWQRRVLPKPK